MHTAGTYKQTRGDKYLYYGLSMLLGGYRSAEDWLRGRVEGDLANKYDDKTAMFIGGDMELLTERNYNRAFANLWKAETVAPYLGFTDASKADKYAASHGHVTGAYHGEGAVVEGAKEMMDETDALICKMTSAEVHKEFEENYSPEQREAVCQIMSLLGHGEAYALYTSSTLLPIVTGTGAKMGMAMQVMEEAKHFMVLREMLRTLDGLRPLSTAARLLFERIAKKDYYNKLFGMNVILESFATNLFSHFEDFPGLRHIMRAFHMDESRHCAFPQTYNQLGLIPDHVTNSSRYQSSRAIMLLPAVPIIFDYKPYFEALNLDVFEFFGRFLAKVTRLSERSGFKLPQSRTEILIGINNLFNGYVRAFEPEKYTGFKDYTLLKKGEISDDMADRERDVFGSDIFGGVGKTLQKIAARQASKPAGRLRRFLSEPVAAA